jgi:four helix bundle protein
VAEGEGLCDLYRATESFPETEIYGLTSQLRGAAVSVPSNIAEGPGRLTGGEFCHFLGRALGSLLESAEAVEWIHRINRIA